MEKPEFSIVREDSADGGVYKALADNGISTGHILYKYAASGTLIAEHTKVEENFSGKGVGQALIQRMLADARATGGKITPVCSYVRHYFEKHAAEVADIAEQE